MCYPAVCHEADICVKACNGSDGRDATVEAQDGRLKSTTVANSATYNVAWNHRKLVEIDPVFRSLLRTLPTRKG